MTREEAIKKLTQLKNKFLDEYIDYDGTTSAYDMAIEALSQPERKHGKWIKNKEHGYYECSNCKSIQPYDGIYEDNPDKVTYWTCDYCPNCGAEMEE